MFDLDPRDVDSRERDGGILDRGDQVLTLGREKALSPDDHDVRGHGDDLREDRDRDRGDRADDRSLDPRDVFVHGLDLPRDHERQLVHDRDREYTLNASDSRTLATVGAFRVVSERDLRDSRDDLDLRHLERQGLIETVPVNEQERAVVLTDEGRDLLERHRESDSHPPQTFYAGADKPRERSHDSHLYRAYLEAAARLQAEEARILRVELDRELKAEYQRFLQERNRGDRDSDGRPDRSPAEIEEWAREHDLPYFDEQVHFPDVRIEYEDPNGDIRWHDVEVTTEHYRGEHASSASRSGFSIHAGPSGGGGRGFDPRVAEAFL